MKINHIYRSISKVLFSLVAVFFANQGQAADIASWYSKRLATPYNLSTNFGQTTHAVKVAEVKKSCAAIVALPGDQIATFCRDSFSSLEGAVYRIDRTGKVLGAAKTEYVGTVPAVLKDGTIVAASNRVLYWLKNDKVVHQYRTSERANLGTVAVLSDDTVVVPEMGLPSRILWFKNGILKQQLAMDFPVASGGMGSEGTVSVESDDSIFVGHGEPRTGISKLYWIDAKAKIRGEIDIDTGLTGTPVLYAPGKIAVAGYDSSHGGRVMWFTAKKSGEIIKSYEYTMGEGIGFMSSAATLPDGTVVGGTGSLDGKTYVLKNGKLISNLGCTIAYSNSSSNGCGWQASAPVLLRDGTVILANQSGYIQWWKNGKRPIFWKFEQNLSDVIYQPVLLSDGTVVLSNGRDEVAWIQLKN